MEDSTTEKTRASINKKIDGFVEEGLEHATEMLSALWEIANKDGDVKAPANTSTAVSPFRFYPPPRVRRGCSLDIARPHRQRALHIGPP